MKRKTTVLALLFCLFTITVNAQTPSQPAKYEFSVQQCIDYGIKNNVQVKNALLDYKIQDQTNKTVTAAAYPQISASAGTTYYPNVTVQTFPDFFSPAVYGVLASEGVKNGNGEPIKVPDNFGFIHAAFGTKWNGNAGVSLSQILFDGEVFVGLQARQTVLDYSKKNIELTQENIKANIYKIYFQLVASKTQIEQLDANIARTQKSLHDANEMFKNGFAENIERGVRFVQLNHAPWDHHGSSPGENLATDLPKVCKATDGPSAALVKDLKQRGLLDSTLVIWGGEFGRSPILQGKFSKDRLGRDHLGTAFTLWMAGGGMRKGVEIGRTDELGLQVVEDPVHIHDLQATFLHALGLEHTKLTYRFQGRDFRLTDVEGNVVQKLLA